MLTVVTHLRTIVRSIAGRFVDEKGQDLIEYALLSGLIAATLIAVGVLAFQGALQSMADGIGRCIDFNSATSCDPLA